MNGLLMKVIKTSRKQNELGLLNEKPKEHSLSFLLASANMSNFLIFNRSQVHSSILYIIFYIVHFQGPLLSPSSFVRPNHFFFVFKSSSSFSVFCEYFLCFLDPFNSFITWLRINSFFVNFVWLFQLFCFQSLHQISNSPCHWWHVSWISIWRMVGASNKWQSLPYPMKYVKATTLIPLIPTITFKRVSNPSFQPFSFWNDHLSSHVMHTILWQWANCIPCLHYCFKLSRC